MSEKCDHVWVREGWTPSYKILEATTYKGVHRMSTDTTWFWPIMQCVACKKIRIHKIYISKEDVENGPCKDGEAANGGSVLELPV